MLGLKVGFVVKEIMHPVALERACSERLNCVRHAIETFIALQLYSGHPPSLVLAQSRHVHSGVARHGHRWKAPARWPVLQVFPAAAQTPVEYVEANAVASSAPISRQYDDMAEQLRVTTDVLHTMEMQRASTEREVSAKLSQISDSVAALTKWLHALTHAVASLARQM